GLDAWAAKPHLQGPTQRVDIDEAVTRAGDVIVLCGVLLGIGDVDGIPDRLDTERSVAGGKVRVLECAGRETDGLEAGVENVDVAGTEVGGEEILAGRQ